jgi:hypothetical protein
MSNLESISPTPESAIACTLTLGEQDLREHDVAALFAQAIQTRELPDGYALAFPAAADSAHTLLDFIVVERACCPFFTFELTFAAPHDAIWLTLKGAEGVKEMLAATFPHLMTGHGAPSEPAEAPMTNEASRGAAE